MTLRDTLRQGDPSDQVGFVSAFDHATSERVEPWYRTTLSYDRHRLAEIKAEIRDEPYEPGDEAWEMARTLGHSAGQDPDCLRAALDVTFVLRTPEDVFDQPGVLERRYRRERRC